MVQKGPCEPQTFSGQSLVALIVRFSTSPLPADCWTDILQFLTHPVWHELQSMSRKFVPILAPLLQHLHSDVQKATFKWLYDDATPRWQITLQFRSGRVDKVLHYNLMPSDAMLATVAQHDTVTVEVNDVNVITNEGIVRFCFGGDGRRLKIHQPMITHLLFARLVEVNPRFLTGLNAASVSYLLHLQSLRVPHLQERGYLK